MTDIINRYAAYGQHVVRVVAALNVDAALHLVVGLDAWQHLGIVHGVSIAQNLWHIVHHLHIPDKGAVGAVPDCP